MQDVLASCAKLSKPPATYGAVLRGERGNGIRYEWMQWMVGRGGTVVKDPENGDYTVTVNSAQNKAALDDFIEVAKKCGAPNPGSLGQGDVIQLLATGKALQGQLVLAAWANFQDPKKSAVVGKLDVVPIPRAADGKNGAVIGNWNYAIPKDISAARRKAALAFAKWFISYDAQYRVREGGRHSESLRRACVGSRPRSRVSLDAGVCGDAEDRAARSSAISKGRRSSRCSGCGSIRR